VVVWAACWALSGCAEHVPLDYAPTAEVLALVSAVKTPLISLGTVQDSRQKDHGPDWLGAARINFGIPLRILRTQKPTAEVVRDAFEHGLRIRGALAERDQGKYQLAATIRKLDCSSYWNLEAHAIIDVQVTDSNGSAFKSSYHADLVREAKGTGIFHVDELRELAQQALSQTVDDALDDYQLRRTLQW
jgi:hypothetical protein